MAAFDTTRMAGTGLSFGGRLNKLASDIAETLKAWNDARETRNALAQLSDRELDDIGLCRGDIENVVAGLRH